MFILFCEVESMSSVGDAFCQGLICQWLFIQRSFDLLFSMPSSFLYVIPFMCNVLKISWLYTGHAFSMYTWCCICFPVHMVLFKSRKKRKKNVALHIFLVTFVLWLLFHGIFGYSCSMWIEQLSLGVWGALVVFTLWLSAMCVYI